MCKIHFCSFFFFFACAEKQGISYSSIFLLGSPPFPPQGWRSWEGRGGSARPNPHILADQLTLSQPGGGLCPPYYYSPPQIFRLSVTLSSAFLESFVENFMLITPWCDVLWWKVHMKGGYHKVCATDYGHTRVKSLILCGPNSNTNHK